MKELVSGEQGGRVLSDEKLKRKNCTVGDRKVCVWGHNEAELCVGGRVKQEERTLSEGIREGVGTMVGAASEGQDERGSGWSGSMNCDGAVRAREQARSSGGQGRRVVQ